MSAEASLLEQHPLQCSFCLNFNKPKNALHSHYCYNHADAFQESKRVQKDDIQTEVLHDTAEDIV